eukprot:SAG22_NODE_74_length_22289_cov_65.265119_20_plen_88_part_00
MCACLSLQLGEVGGAGLRLYFDIVLGFAKVFLFCTVATIPCLVLNIAGNLDSEQFSSLWNNATVAGVSGSLSNYTTVAGAAADTLCE